MTAYTKGRQFEYRVRDHFLSLGYVVIRSPQSRSPFDLAVIGHSKVLLVQCKAGGSLPPIEWDALHEAADSCSAIPILVTRRKRRMQVYLMLSTRGTGRLQPKALTVIGPNEPEPWERENGRPRPKKAEARA